VVATRKCASTTFVAVHEPFRGRHRIRYVRRVDTQIEDVLAVELTVYDELKPDESSPGILHNDYLLIDLREDTGTPVTVDRQMPRCRFKGFAFLRRTDAGIEAVGDISGIVDLDERGGLVLNGKPMPMRRVGDCKEYGDLKAPTGSFTVQGRHRYAEPPVELATRWIPDTALCLHSGGKACRKLRLQNHGRGTAHGTVRIKASPGLRIEPAEIDVRDFAPGDERDVFVTVTGDGTRANRLGQLQLVGNGPESPARQRQRYLLGMDPGVIVAPTVLPVAEGVCVRRSQQWPGSFASTIYAPRYIAKTYYMESGATSLLLDPAGCRRSDSSGASYPQIVRFGADDRGREGWRAESVPKFPYFVPVVIPAAGEKPAYVYEAGWHAHGSRSAMEHRFTEDWILVRFLEAKPDERIALSWHPQSRKNGLAATIMGRDPALAREKMPGKVLVVTPDGAPHDAGDPDQWPRRADLPREVDQIAAVFHRPHGYEHGMVLLYPEDSRRERDYVTQPGDRPMGFTFATEAEFPTMVKRWQENPPPAEPSEQERSTYGAAFMPHLEPAD